MDTTKETLTKGAVKLVLSVHHDGSYYAIGGDREPGEGDTKFIGLERIKARIAALEAELKAVMVFVDKWLDQDELKQSPANRANTAREKALTEIERLAAELEALRKRLEYTYCAYCGEEIEIADMDKARESVAAHVMSCPEHPYADLKTELEQAKAQRSIAIRAIGIEAQKRGFLEAELEAVKADLKLRAESYDANSRGWQDDIKDLKSENKRLRLAAQAIVSAADRGDTDEIYHRMRGLRAALAGKEIENEKCSRG